MSKSVKKVVGIVAAIAIPFAAPAIAGAIGLSGAIGATLGSAVTGAVLGGISSNLTGGDWRRGALLGGLSGGIGGYMQGTPASASAPVTEAVPSYVAPGEAGAAGLAEAGTTAGVTGAEAAGGFAGAAAPAETFVGAATGAPVSEAVPTWIAPEAAAAAPSAGLSNAVGVAGGAPVSEAIPAYIAPTAGAATPATTAATAATPGAWSAADEAVLQSMRSATAAPKLTFMQALKQVPSTIAAKFRDPKALADLTLRAAGVLAGSAIAGDGLSAEEQKLLAAQRQELEYLQANNQALFQERLNQARGLLGEAKYFDPNYFGLQQAAGVQLRGARAKEEALAGIDPRRAGLRAAEERRANLAIGRDVGTAYSQGYQQGVEGRTGLLQAGLQQLPTGAPATMLGSYGQTLANMYSGAAGRQAQTQQDIGALFESFRSPYRTEEERNRSNIARQGLFG